MKCFARYILAQKTALFWAVIANRKPFWIVITKSMLPRDVIEQSKIFYMVITKYKLYWVVIAKETLFWVVIRSSMLFWVKTIQQKPGITLKTCCLVFKTIKFRQLKTLSTSTLMILLMIVDSYFIRLYWNSLKWFFIDMCMLSQQ